MSRTTAHRPGRRNRTALAALAAATIGLGLTAFGAPAVAFGAGPSEVVYDTGSLDWGVKQSFRSYVSGPIGQGAIEVTGGATRNADGTFHFGLGSARYDLGTHTLSAGFAGGVRFTAHAGQLDVSLSDLKLTTSGTTGTLTADTASKEQIGGPLTERQDVPLATFVVARDTTTGAATPAKLTEEGAKAFAGFYPAGSDLDPLSVLLVQSPVSPSPSPSASATATTSASATATATESATATATATATESATSSASPSATSTGSPSASASASASTSASASGSATASGSASAGATATRPASGELAIVNGTLDWTVKESFRKYLAGPVAAGKVEFGGGAADYRFGGATGSYNTATHAVTAGFNGSVRFLGHPATGGGYALDTTFSKFGVRIDQGGAFLTADVSAKSQDGRSSTPAAVRVAKLDLSGASFAPVNGVVTLTGVPATLTAEGVPAFGNYPAGEALDPVSFSLAFDAAAPLPSAPAGAQGGASSSAVAAGSTGTGTGTGTGASLTTTGLGGGAALASTGAGTPVVPLLATAAGLVLLGGSTTVLVRRRKGAAQV